MKQKTVLFFPLNSPGHVNSSLGIADVIKRDYNCRTVFLILGKMMGNDVVDHGHELITLKEVSPVQDFEIEDDEDLTKPIDEAAMLAAGKTKKIFEGVFKWPQLIRRCSHIFTKSPLESFVTSTTFLEEYMVGELVDNHDSYAKAVDEIKPDLIVIDAYYIPPCVLNAKVPWVRLYSANPLILTNSKLPDGIKPSSMMGFKLENKAIRERIRKEEPEKWQAMLNEWQDCAKVIGEAVSKVGGKLNSFLEIHKCTPLPFGKQAHDSPYLNIYMFPEAIDYDQDDDLLEYPNNWIRCDSLMRQSASSSNKGAQQLAVWADRLAEASNDKEAKVFFSLGSIASGNSALMKKFVNFFSKDKKKLFIISKGANGHKYELDNENMIGDNYIPQTYLLQQVDLAIIHGGNNSVTECMYYGKPMIVLPVFADQLDNAQRVEDLGLGRRLNFNNCTQDTLLNAIDEILADQLMRDKLRCIGEKMRSCNDLEKVTKALMNLID